MLNKPLLSLVLGCKRAGKCKRSLEVAAAGGHNLLMIGAPRQWKINDGKTTSSSYTPLSLGESLETTKIHSVARKLGKILH